MKFNPNNEEYKKICSIFTDTVILGVSNQELFVAYDYFHDFDKNNEDDAIEFFEGLTDTFEVLFLENYMPRINQILI